ncbi:14469_t:CDS:1, partial [Gigaspora rosea]
FDGHIVMNVINLLVLKNEDDLKKMGALNAFQMIVEIKHEYKSN